MNRKFIKVNKNDFMTLVGNDITPEIIMKTSIYINNDILLIKSYDDINVCKQAMKYISDTLTDHNISHTNFNNQNQMDQFIQDNPIWQTQDIDDFVGDKKKGS